MRDVTAAARNTDAAVRKVKLIIGFRNQSRGLICCLQTIAFFSLSLSLSMLWQNTEWFAEHGRKHQGLKELIKFRDVRRVVTHVFTRRWTREPSRDPLHLRVRLRRNKWITAERAILKGECWLFRPQIFVKLHQNIFYFIFFYYYFSETQRRISLNILYGGDKLDGEPVNKMQTSFRGFGSNLKGAFVSSLSTNRASDSEAEMISYRL